MPRNQDQVPHGAGLVADHTVRQRKMTEEVERQPRNIVRISVVQVKMTVQRKNLENLDLVLAVEGAHGPGPVGGLVQGLGLVQDLVTDEEDQDLGIIEGGQDLDLVVEHPQMVPDFM